MMHYAGEPAVARVAERIGVPYGLSTLGTTSIEELAAAVPGARRWFQLYLMTDRGYGVELVDRAQSAGYDTIILTVDTPVAGRRHRDVRNGLTIPPQLTARTLADMAVHPRWWLNLLTTEPLSFATLTSTEGTVADLIGRVFDPFYTTKGVGEGTGLGLSIVKHLVEAHGGKVSAESQLGRGTAISCWFPANA